MFTLLQIAGGIGEMFPSSELLMPSEMPEGVALAAAQWRDYPLNSALVIAATLLIVLNLQNIYSIASDVIGSIFRWRSNNAIESSMSRSRDRDNVALSMILPFCLLMGRYQVLGGAAERYLPVEWMTAGYAAVFAAWMLLRFVARLVIDAKSCDRSTLKCASKCSRTYFISMTVVLVASAGILSLLGVSDRAVRVVIICEFILSYLIHLLRKGQILANSCNGFVTFLYLCALEILPLGITVFLNKLA